MEHKFSLIRCSETQKPLFAAQQLRGAAGAWWENFLAIQNPGHQVTWVEFKDTFHAHYIPEGLMAMKAEDFLALQQGDKSVMEYMAKFNHLSQYATDHMDIDRKKKAYFMRGLNTKLQTMMTTCQNATFYEAVNIAIASEEKNRKHKEAKKKATSSSFSGRGQKCQRIIYHPQGHGHFPASSPFRGPFSPSQYRHGQQVYPRPTAITTAPRQSNAPGVRPTALPNHNYPCYNCGKPRHFSKECPYPRQNNPTFQRPPIGQPQPSQFKNGAQKGQNAQRGKPAKKVGQVFHKEVETIPEGEPVMMGTFPVAKHPTLMLFDSGASHTFINRTFVMKHGIPIGETNDHFYIQSPGG